MHVPWLRGFDRERQIKKLMLARRKASVKEWHLPMTKITYQASHDYYRILGIRPRARPDKIRAAYVAAMRRAHPDLNPGRADATAAAQNLNNAYEVLSHPELRAEYDRQRREYFKLRTATAARRRRNSRVSAPADPESRQWLEMLARLARGLFNGLTSR
jgi:curved DNA-binding protein CbpA